MVIKSDREIALSKAIKNTTGVNSTESQMLLFSKSSGDYNIAYLHLAWETININIKIVCKYVDGCFRCHRILKERL